jgi:hypothetical protein
MVIKGSGRPRQQAFWQNGAFEGIVRKTIDLCLLFP